MIGRFAASAGQSRHQSLPLHRTLRRCQGAGGGATLENGMPRRLSVGLRPLKPQSAAAAQDFAEVLARPRLVVLGAGLQYTVMPLMGLAVSRAAGLAAPLAVG